MYKTILYLFFLSIIIAFPAYSHAFFEKPKDMITDSLAVTELTETQELYNELELDSIVNYKMFEEAMIGYNKLDIPNKDIITLIDFSKPSTEKRLYVIDLKEKKVLYTSHVSHGKRSGWKYATSFSNKMRSNRSSLGFYITGNTYNGRRGYSLKLDGQERGINDNAGIRGVVIHGAKYANPDLLSQGEDDRILGRSLGCPALPMSAYRPIINTIKEGTMLFIYADNDTYKQKSTILKSNT